jgi:hypothetical protein
MLMLMLMLSVRRQQMQMALGRFEKTVVALVGIALLGFASWPLTMWLAGSPSGRPFFFTMVGLSGPSLFYFGSHASETAWFIGFALVCCPVLVATIRNNLSWRSAAWTAAVWGLECFFLGATYFLM